MSTSVRARQARHDARRRGAGEHRGVPASWLRRRVKRSHPEPPWLDLNGVGLRRTGDDDGCAARADCSVPSGNGSLRHDNGRECETAPTRGISQFVGRSRPCDLLVGRVHPPRTARNSHCRPPHCGSSRDQRRTSKHRSWRVAMLEDTTLVRRAAGRERGGTSVANNVTHRIHQTAKGREKSPTADRSRAQVRRQIGVFRGLSHSQSARLA